MHHNRAADSMMTIGISLAICYWFLDTLLNLFMHSRAPFFSLLLGPDTNDLWPRVIVFCLFLIYGSHVQYTINSRRNAEVALQESEEKHRRILDSIEEGYFEIDLEGNLTFANNALLRIAQSTQAELIGKNYREYTAAATAERLYHIYRQVYATGKPTLVDRYEVCLPDGSTKVLEASVSLLHHRNGEPIGFRGVARDISDRVATEEKRKSLEVQLQNAGEAAILGLATLAEGRDQNTGDHLKRIRTYARIIAEQLMQMPKYGQYITPAYIEDLYRSAILHDIGKVGTPDAILYKPGRLTPNEYEVMKRHTLLGGNILKSMEAKLDGQSFLTLGKEIAFFHHEHWNGNGYPFGLKGEKIPLSARIVALADVYDALTSVRSYKSAMSHLSVVEKILDHRGQQFDPDVVDAFMARQTDFARISEPETKPATRDPSAVSTSVRHNLDKDRLSGACAWRHRVATGLVDSGSLNVAEKALK